jgi:hypothetical protein
LHRETHTSKVNHNHLPPTILHQFLTKQNDVFPSISSPTDRKYVFKYGRYPFLKAEGSFPPYEQAGRSYPMTLLGLGHRKDEASELGQHRH